MLYIVIVIAFGLAMDAVAVSIVYGFYSKGKNILLGLKISTSFSIFQMGMPVIGYFLGLSFINIVKEYDHWIAFILLSMIGLHMIYESFKKEEDRIFNIHSNKALFVLSISTSIDALIFGISLIYLKLEPVKTILIIGIITFVLSFISYLIGKILYKIFGRKIEILGGIILISIGIKTLFEHLFSK